MTERFLHDTNIVSELMRNPHGPVSRHIARVGEANVCTSIIVAAELGYGAARGGSPRLLVQLDAVLRSLETMPLEPPSDRIYGDLRARLEWEGRLIGPNDLLIAAQSLALDCTMVTANLREFSRVPDLRMENWRD